MEHFGNAARSLKVDAEKRSKVFEALKRSLMETVAVYHLDEARVNMAVARMQSTLIRNTQAATEEELIDIGTSAMLEELALNEDNRLAICADLVESATAEVNNMSNQVE